MQWSLKRLIRWRKNSDLICLRWEMCYDYKKKISYNDLIFIYLYCIVLYWCRYHDHSQCSLSPVRRVYIDNCRHSCRYLFNLNGSVTECNRVQVIKNFQVNEMKLRLTIGKTFAAFIWRYQLVTFEKKTRVDIQSFKSHWQEHLSWIFISPISRMQDWITDRPTYKHAVFVVSLTDCIC